MNEFEKQKLKISKNIKNIKSNIEKRNKMSKNEEDFVLIGIQIRSDIHNIKLDIEKLEQIQKLEKFLSFCFLIL